MTMKTWDITYTPEYGLVVLETKVSPEGWRSARPVVSLNSGYAMSPEKNDAALIAAAPKMLELLNRARDFAKQYPVPYVAEEWNAELDRVFQEVTK